MERVAYNNIPNTPFASGSRSLPPLVQKTHFLQALSRSQPRPGDPTLLCMHCNQDADYVCLAAQCTHRVFCFDCNPKHPESPACRASHVLISKLGYEHRDTDSTDSAGSTKRANTAQANNRHQRDHDHDHEQKRKTLRKTRKKMRNKYQKYVGRAPGQGSLGRGRGN